MVTADTTASLATAAGTLVLAVATFASVRSANRAARAAERSLLEGLRPLLVTSRLHDPPEKISWADQHWTRVDGGRGAVEVTDEVIYLAIALRNVGRGMAVLHGWVVHAGSSAALGDRHTRADDFTMLTRDLYVPAGDLGFWQGALRDPSHPLFSEIAKAATESEPITIELLYGDHEGGQRMISRFTLLPHRSQESEFSWIATVSRHRHLDGREPR